MDRPSLLELIRARFQQLLGGYLETPALSGDVGSYLVRPALGDRAGVLGAIALAQTLERGA
jgi:fructokinase